MNDFLFTYVENVYYKEYSFFCGTYVKINYSKGFKGKTVVILLFCFITQGLPSIETRSNQSTLSFSKFMFH